MPEDPAASVTAERLRTQLLSGTPAAAAGDVVRRLLAVQAQDPRGARLAVRARSRGLHAADVDHAVSEERSLVVSWLNRGTLHLVAAEDFWWLRELTAPTMVSTNARRLDQEGVPAADAERAVATIVGALERDGPLTRAQLREQVAPTGVRVAGQAMVHLLLLATLRGAIVRGPIVGREQAFVLVRDWLGAPPKSLDTKRFAREAALAELAVRYLRGHAPASERDLAKWAGLPVSAARAGLAAIAARLRHRPDGLLELRSQPVDGRGGRADLPGPRLLGSYDPVLHGWVDRGPILGEHTSVVTSNGLFRPFALVSGRAVATWSWS
ncbi:MAG TPA: crosslink repair DNA glycosylase YcaQ family protein, partial [Actinomycetes bacterium]|nr:crosslink repair DNA glycosylase YcaQ family protein [Actinomycetes bacterium]